MFEVSGSAPAADNSVSSQVDAVQVETGDQQTSQQGDFQQATTQSEGNPLLDYLNGTGNKWVTQAAALQQAQGAGQELSVPATVEPPVQQVPGQELPPTQQAPSKEPQINGSQQGIPVPDKFKNADGSVNIEAVLKSYGFLEQKLGEQGNQLGQVQTLQQKIEELTAAMQQQQAQNVNNQQQTDQTSQQEQQPQYSEEQVAEMNEKWLQDFYENPLQSVGRLISMATQNAITPAIQQIETKYQPLLSEREQAAQMQRQTAQVDAIAKQNPQEFESLKPYMAKILQEQAHVINALPEQVNGQEFNKVEYVFNQARAIKAMETAQQMASQIKTPEQMMSDPNFLQQILQNDQIRQMFAKNQVEAIRQNRPPVVIGNQPTGVSPAAPAPQVKSVKEATPSALNYFKKIVSGGGF